MLTYSTLVRLGIASKPCSPDGDVWVVYVLMLLSSSLRIVDPCRIGLVRAMCALVLCVVLATVFGYSGLHGFEAIPNQTNAEYVSIMKIQTD